jgi:intracellular sulfur oxidation DsrE/DsrF family protein
MKYINVLGIALALSLSVASLHAAASDAAATKEHVVVQVSDADPAKWNLALNNVKNVQQMLGADKVDAEIVVYGPGIAMLKMDSAVASRIEEAKKANVTIVAWKIQ